MMRMKSASVALTLLLVLLVYTGCGTDAWTWFGSSGESEKSQDVSKNRDMDSSHSSNTGGISLKEKLKFEMKMADDKFLLEAKIAQEMSPLDACHHRIVAEIEGTCAEMSEEGLSKLSVQLLNCQSTVEGRQTYLCTTDMTIGECTREMDAVTWNSYQIVSNRARALCYATRQNLFRMRTELTIDRLLSTSVDQLYTLQDLETGQNRLRETAEGTLERLEEGQEKLKEGQRALNSEQSSLQSSISSNLQDLRQESQLISSATNKLTSLTESVSLKLDNTSVKLDEQAATLETRHNSLAERLVRLDGTAQEVVERLEGTSGAVEGLRRDTVEHLSQTLEGLKQLNSSVDFLSRTIDNLSHRVNSALTWISRAIGGTDDHLMLLTTVMHHSLYFIVSLFVCVFLCLPATTRLLLLVTVPLNSLLTLRHCSVALELPRLTLALVLIALCDLATRWLCERQQLSSSKHHHTSPQTSSSSSSELVPASSGDRTLDIRRVISLLEQLCRDSNGGELNCSRISQGYHSLSPDSAPSSSSSSATTTAGSRLSGLGGFLFSPPAVHRVVSPPPIPTNPPPSPVYDVHSTATSPALDSKELMGVRRHLVNTLITSDGQYSPISSRRTLSRSSSPARTSTPLRSCSRSRNSSMNRSVFRAPCLAETRTGRPCKLSCIDGSEFCHMHQGKGGSTPLNQSCVSVSSTRRTPTRAARAASAMVGGDDDSLQY